MTRSPLTKLAVLFFTAMLLATALTLSCSGDGGGSPIKKAKITGVSQKGPFVKGSSATLYELDGNFAQTGRSFRDIIADDYGKFEIKNVELVSPYAMLEADGFYRNEVTGQTSAAPIKLYAIADIREKDNVNVNLLTHLEYYRVLNLVEGGKTVAEAKKQAQKEILAVFGINGDFENSEDMSIFGTTEGDAALLAISVLLQGDLSEGDFSQRLTDFAQDLKLNGTWGNEAAKKAMADWAASYANLKGIKNGILGWGLSSEVPDFGEYVTDYWTVAYGLGGCGLANEREIKSAPSIIGVKEYICKNGIWQWEVSSNDKYCAENECEYFVDSRDNKQYAYVTIAEQTWMTENLRYEAKAASSCGNINGCNYSWSKSMGFDENCDGKDDYCFDKIHEPHQGVCPDGWHIPSKNEWHILVERTNGSIALGDDNYGFGYGGSYWSVTIEDGYPTGLVIDNLGITFYRYGSNSGNSVRCLKD